MSLKYFGSENVKKCPKCDTEMEEGFLVGGAHMWAKGTSLFTRKKCRVIAYHCPKCGYVMLYEEGK